MMQRRAVQIQIQIPPHYRFPRNITAFQAASQPSSHIFNNLFVPNVCNLDVRINPSTGHSTTFYFQQPLYAATFSTKETQHLHRSSTTDKGKCQKPDYGHFDTPQST
jgi:hypothetical protein